jgi:hypothetical protein
MLQRRLLIQLHTYVCLMASPSEEEPRLREDDVPFTARVGGRSLSTPNALSFGSPSRIPFQDICLVMGGWETLVVTSKKPGYCWNKRCFYMSILTCLSLLSPLYCHGSEGEAPSLSS